MNELTPEVKQMVQQIQENLETALKNLHNAIKSSGLEPNQNFLNAMCRLDEYSFWMGQCAIRVPESNVSDGITTAEELPVQNEVATTPEVIHD